MAEDISRRDAEALKDLRSQEVSITRELIDLRDKLVTLSRADVLNLEEVANIQSRSLELEKQRQTNFLNSVFMKKNYAFVLTTNFYLHQIMPG